VTGSDQGFCPAWPGLSARMGLISTVPMIVAGISLWTGAGGGLYWALAEIVSGLIASVIYAWVLLIEILR
jgi:hypothetical protein